MTDYSDIAFNETFDTVYNDMLQKKNSDSSFKKSDLKELLDTLYINEGNNWVGQSEIVILKNSAAIAACEAILADWE